MIDIFKIFNVQCTFQSFKKGSSFKSESKDNVMLDN